MADYNSGYTGAEIDSAIAKVGGIEAGAEVNTVDSVNGETGTVVLDSDDIAEGSTNKYLTGDEVISDTTGVTGADAITNVMSLTQSEYDAIGSPDSTTLYVITD